MWKTRPLTFSLDEGSNENDDTDRKGCPAGTELAAVPSVSEGPANLVETLSFGAYRMQPTQRRLVRRDGEEVQLGGRAFDILLVLLENAGKIVSQRDLLDRVWADVYVEEGNLRVHIAGLRRALGESDDGVAFIETIPRRGYSFVAPVVREITAIDPAPALSVSTASEPPVTLPPLLARMVGRDTVIVEVAELIDAHRFVTVVGTGGMGKTTVALAIAHTAREQMGCAAVFVDLSTVSSGDLVDTCVASALGIGARSSDVRAELLGYLRRHEVLLILDNCEHVIEAAALLAEHIVAECPSLRMLATSREALRAEGENVYFLAALESPGEGVATAEEAMAWPAVQLFMERAAANGYRAPLSDTEAPVVAAICRRLDGIALAIELAAGRVMTHGIDGMANLLNHRFKLMWQGRRSAVPRQQTMQAMLDWSFNLLAEPERLVLSQLSVLVGSFSLSAAQQMVDVRMTAMEAGEILTSLANKSLVWTNWEHGEMRFRLLDMTRAYAAAKLEESGTLEEVSRRHAHHVLDRVLVANGAEADSAPGSRGMADLVGNLRAALQWCFSSEADRSLAVTLAARSVPLLINLSLFPECARWCGEAIDRLEDAHRDGMIELALREGIAVSGMFTRGNGDDIRMTIERGIDLAEATGSHEHELRLLSGLHIYMARTGDMPRLMEVSERAARIAVRTGRDDLIAMAEWMLGTACHLRDDQAGAQRYCEAALRRSAGSNAAQFTVFGFDHRVRGLIVLARALWLRGAFDQSANVSREVVAEAKTREHPVALCIALIYTTTAAIWSGELEVASERIDLLIDCAAANSLEPYRAVGLAMRGEVMVLRGDLAGGIAELRAALAILEAERHRVLSTGFLRTLAEALGENGQVIEALAVIDKAETQAKENFELYQIPDLHRARGEILLRLPSPDVEGAEREFRRAIEEARVQEIYGWEARAALGFARLLISLGRGDEALLVLDDALARIEEGYGQPVMRAIVRLREQLGDESG
jgi:predicted ATPase/DNA-binding winged helix-turn-helix (wHTH) protein